MKEMTGFDYRLGKEVSRTKKEWGWQLQDVIKSGGFRRVDNGETFGHIQGGTIAFEVYGYLPGVKS